MAQAKSMDPISVHQTLLFPATNLTPLSVTTIPLAEIAHPGEATESVASDLLAEAPGMTFWKWKELWDQLAGSTSWDALANSFEPSALTKPPDQIAQRVWTARESLDSVHTEVDYARLLLQRALKSNSGVSGRTVFASRNSPGSPRPGAWQIPQTYELLLQVALDSVETTDVTPDEAWSWAYASAALVGRASPGMANTFTRMQGFDVPFALSKTSDRTTLASLLDKAEFVTFFPLGAGAVDASHLILQGDYAVAMQVVTFSGLATLVLAGSYRIGATVLTGGLRRRTRSGKRGT